MSTSEDAEPIVVAMAAASESLRAACHEKDTPVDPAALYGRCGELVEILARLRQVVSGLASDVARADATIAELASDDDTNASEHAETARAQLTNAVEDLAAAGVAADLAFNALSHLKLDG